MWRGVEIGVVIHRRIGMWYLCFKHLYLPLVFRERESVCVSTLPFEKFS